MKTNPCASLPYWVCLRCTLSFHPLLFSTGAGSTQAPCALHVLKLTYMVKRRQKGLQVPAVGQYPANKSSSGLHDLAGYLNEGYQETFEFHPQNITTCCRHNGYQTIPGLQIPGQRRDDHIGPVRYQPIRRHPQRVDTTLQLTDDVFLVAAIVGEKNDFLIGFMTIVGNVEKVPHVIDKC
jgi:hypothetical protein